MKGRTVLLVLGAIAVGVLIWSLSGAFPGSLDNDYDQARLVRAVGILALVGAGLVAAPRLSLKGAAKGAAIWIAIGVSVFAVYAIRDDLQALGHRMMGELAPGRGATTADGALEIRRGTDGHFHLIADVDGARVNFLVDTGASVVALSHADAERIGIDPSRLTYDRTSSTAGGPVRAAAVRIGRIEAGPLTATDVRGTVLQSDGGTSLLGMSFLNEMGSVEIGGDRMTIRPRD